jgi:hypothetical protein
MKTNAGAIHNSTKTPQCLGIFLYTHIYILAHICIYIYMCLQLYCIYIYLYIYKYMYMYLYIYTHTYVSMPIHWFTLPWIASHWVTQLSIANSSSTKVSRAMFPQRGFYIKDSKYSFLCEVLFGFTR